jgi:hypothetical protein
MTTKPTIFFSHSSKDERILRELKERLLQKVGGTLDVFLSSDGQSIQLGRNWVHKIEDALNSARIMFVFVSPSSLPSKWVYFESGFSYSKGIRVIPVGILGIDLNDVPAPLSLLQGFNIRNADGLNNLITIINDEFKFSFKSLFTTDDHDAIFVTFQVSTSNDLGSFASSVDEIEFSKSIQAVDAESRLKEALTQSGVEFQVVKNRFHSFGASFAVDEEKKALSISLDANLIAKTFPLAELVLRSLGATTDDSYAFKIVFVSGVEEIVKYHKRTSRLFDSGISLAPNGSFKFRNMEFTFDHYTFYDRVKVERGRTFLNVLYKGEHLELPNIAELLDLLFLRELLETDSYL